MTGTEFVLREEQVNAYKNLAVDQVESLRRLNRDWSLLKFLSSGSVYDNHAQQSVNYHERFPAISPKYGKRINYHIQHNSDTDKQQKTASSVKAQDGSTPTNRDWSGLKRDSSGHVYEMHKDQCVNYDKHVPAIIPKYRKGRKYKVQHDENTNNQQKTDTSVKGHRGSSKKDMDCSQLWDNYDEQFPALA